jgi:hypothetical protein
MTVKWKINRNWMYCADKPATMSYQECSPGGVNVGGNGKTLSGNISDKKFGEKSHTKQQTSETLDSVDSHQRVDIVNGSFVGLHLAAEICYAEDEVKRVTWTGGS